VQVCKLLHAKSADNVVERALTNCVFGCRVVSSDVGELLSETDHCQNFSDQHLHSFGVLHLQCIFGVWQHNDMGVVVECNNQ
jgi:hypothetical protein